jgi:flagellar motor switch protein FliM
MKTGDVFELNLGRQIEAKVAGVPVFDCQYGLSNGRYALKVGRTLTGPNDGWLEDPGGVPPGTTKRKTP